MPGAALRLRLPRSDPRMCAAGGQAQRQQRRQHLEPLPRQHRPGVTVPAFRLPRPALSDAGRKAPPRAWNKQHPRPAEREHPMRDIGHFIAGKQVAGTSGRTGDVFDPNTGEVQAKVALASKSEVEKAIANAQAAFPGWAATNPQRRARVLFKFLELIQAEYDDLARLLSSEHGKTFADAKGDIQRGLEVVEFACGIPHLMKGEFSEGAGPGIDLFSIRQPLGVVAGITPFNFPAMIPLWKCAPAIACGNAFALKPSERDPSVPVRLPELFLEAGLPPGVFQVVHGDKEAVDAILEHPDIKAVGFVGSSDIAQYIYSNAAANGKRSQ